MTPFLILSTMTSAMLMLLAALMDRRAIRAGRAGRRRWLVLSAGALSALMTAPIGWVVWVAAGLQPLINLCVASALWHLGAVALLSLWNSSLYLRRQADAAKKA